MSNWKKNRKTVKVKCKFCGNVFDKIKTEYDRIEKTTGNHYCSRNCVGKDSFKNKLGDKFGKQNNPTPPNKIDKYTGFREFIRRAKYRDKLGDLTLDDLKLQWEKQKGICPYSGIILKLPNQNKNKEYKIYELASLDRIDSNKAYEKNNIVFVSATINYMKNTMTEIDTISFCKKITYFWKDKL